MDKKVFGSTQPIPTNKLTHFNSGSFRPDTNASDPLSWHLTHLVLNKMLESNWYTINPRNRGASSCYVIPTYKTSKALNELSIKTQIVLIFLTSNLVDLWFLTYSRSVYVHLLYLSQLCMRSASDIFPEFPVSSWSNIVQICNMSFSVTFPISFSLYITYSALLRSSPCIPTQLTINDISNYNW